MNQPELDELDDTLLGGGADDDVDDDSDEYRFSPPAAALVFAGEYLRQHGLYLGKELQVLDERALTSVPDNYISFSDDDDYSSLSSGAVFGLEEGGTPGQPPTVAWARKYAQAALCFALANLEEDNIVEFVAVIDSTTPADRSDPNA